MKRTGTIKKSIDTALYQYYGKYIDILAISLLAALVLIIFFSIFFRYFLHLPLAEIEELATILLVWLIMIGAVSASRQGKHLKTDELVKLFRPGVQKLAYRVINLLACFFILSIIGYGFDMSKEVMMIKTDALQVSQSTMYIALPIGFMLMLPFHVRNIILGSDKGMGE